MSKKSSAKLTLAHVTHEAVEKIGGIGTVLEGMMTSPVYQGNVKRSILVGPTATHMATDPAQRLGEDGEVFYSSIDQIDAGGFGNRFRPVEWAFNVAIVYGKRTYHDVGSGRTGEAEVLLIDVFRANPDRLNVFKLRLWETFGLDSAKYEKMWDYEEYVRIAEPAYYGLLAILNEDDYPCVLFGHEFMGLPAALQCILDGQEHFRTVFHAHECATARRLVEDHPGHDTMFYNVLDRAAESGRYVEDIFGPLDQHLRHALVSRAHLCDGVIAVGNRTRDELHFLNEDFREKQIDLVFNGLPAFPVTLKEKNASRDMLVEYTKAILGFEPDVCMTHVTRPVVSKGMWRDMKVCHELDGMFADAGKRGVLYILTSGGGVRRPQDILAMEQRYGWPVQHRHGYPDLVGPEVDLNSMVNAFNDHHNHVRVVLVNQFGWSGQRIGSKLPKDMDIADLRRATDVEFGMATYEPFGISPLEPLGSGALCVISNVCGCQAFVDEVTGGSGSGNVIVADCVTLEHGPTHIHDIVQIDDAFRDGIEQHDAKRVAEKIMDRLPWDDAGRQALIDEGQRLVKMMGWDQVITNEMLPMLRRIVSVPMINSVKV